MNSQKTIEIQAVMNLLYIGDDEDPPVLKQTFPKR